MPTAWPQADVVSLVMCVEQARHTGEWLVRHLCSSPPDSNPSSTTDLGLTFG